MTSKYENDLGTYYDNAILVFAESDEIAVSQTIFNVGLASCAALLVCLFLIPFPSVAIFVTYTVTQILVGVLGYMRYAILFELFEIY